MHILILIIFISNFIFLNYNYKLKLKIKMSLLQANQSTKATLSTDPNLNALELQEKKRRRCDIPCKNEPQCPYNGFWRTDTKSAGGEKGLCKNCLKLESDKNIKL